LNRPNTMRMQVNEGMDEHERADVPEEYFEFKSRIHDRLLDQLDLSALDKVDPSILKPEMRRVVDKILRRIISPCLSMRPKRKDC